MNKYGVRDLVKEIAAIARSDSKLARECEADLRHKVLCAIASDDCVDPRECAQAALTTSDIDYNKSSWGGTLELVMPLLYGFMAGVVAVLIAIGVHAA